MTPLIDTNLDERAAMLLAIATTWEDVLSGFDQHCTLSESLLNDFLTGAAQRYADPELHTLDVHDRIRDLIRTVTTRDLYVNHGIVPDDMEDEAWYGRADITDRLTDDVNWMLSRLLFSTPRCVVCARSGADVSTWGEVNLYGVWCDLHGRRA